MAVLMSLFEMNENLWLEAEWISKPNLSVLYIVHFKYCVYCITLYSIRSAVCIVYNIQPQARFSALPGKSLDPTFHPTRVYRTKLSIFGLLIQ